MRIRKNKHYKTSVMLIMLVCVLCISACAGKGGAADLSSPEKALEETLMSLQSLDLKTFNACTNNCVLTHKNWLGIPTVKEYRVFDQLLQPGFIKGEKYRGNKEFAKNVVECLSWQIGDIREQGDRAEIDVALTNKDLCDVMGNYMIHVFEEMIASNGTGLQELISDLSELDTAGGRFSADIKAVDQYNTIAVTVQVKKVGSSWQVLLSDEFINAFMGNFSAERYSEDVEKRLAELEQEYEGKMDQWGDELGEKVERWAEDLFE